MLVPKVKVYFFFFIGSDGLMDILILERSIATNWVYV